MTLAAAYSNLKLNWINGVSGKDVSCKRSKYNYHSLLILGIGWWYHTATHGQPAIAFRTIERKLESTSQCYTNVCQSVSHSKNRSKRNRVVERDINTALIMEDDLDWDIRIKNQLSNFALASRVLIQPQSLDQEQRSYFTFQNLFCILTHRVSMQTNKICRPLVSSPKVKSGYHSYSIPRQTEYYTSNDLPVWRQLGRSLAWPLRHTFQRQSITHTWRHRFYSKQTRHQWRASNPCQRVLESHALIPPRPHVSVLACICSLTTGRKTYTVRTLCEELYVWVRQYAAWDVRWRGDARNEADVLDNTACAFYALEVQRQ